LEEVLSNKGLSIKNYYFISETFYDRNDDDISYKKIKLLLQHLVGLKSDGDILLNEEISKYEEIYYYDNNKSSIMLASNINSILEKLLIKSDKGVQLKVKDVIKNNDPCLRILEYTYNKRKKFNESFIALEYSNIIKKFESFNSSF